MGNVMRNIDDITIAYEISETAKQLQKELNISWSLQTNSLYDGIYYLRCCNKTPIIVPITNPITIPTGIYLQLTDPYYEILLRSYSDILQTKHLGVLNYGYEYGYRKELYLILNNFGSSDAIVNPGDIIGLFSVNRLSRVTFRLTDRLEDSLVTKDNTWVFSNKLAKHKPLPDFKIDTESMVKNIIKDRQK